MVDFCGSLYNYCIDKRIELEEELKKPDVVIEIRPGVFLDAPILNDSGSPTENLDVECFCQNCRVSGRARRKADDSRGAELEQIVRYCALLRPYWRRSQFIQINLAHSEDLQSLNYLHYQFFEPEGVQVVAL